MNQFQQHFQPFLEQLEQANLPALPQPDPQPEPQPDPQPDPHAFEFIRGKNRNSRQLLYLGQRYTKSKTHNDTTYYRCINHKRDARYNPLPCKSTLHFSDGMITRQPSPHNHRSDNNEV